MTKDTGLDRFRKYMRTNVRALWSGAWDEIEFLDGVFDTLNTGYHNAWFEGAKECGIQPDEITVVEEERITRKVYEDYQYAFGFAEYIVENSRANGGRLYRLYPRVELWVNNYREMRNIGRFMACSNKKYKWVTHAEESCPSCIKLDGKVKRMSYWKEHDVHPQHPHKLQCMIDAKGVPVCKCEFVPTDEPLSRGRLPNLP